ncbi:hypothetical protein [Vibrio algarum]|uniref:DUF5666 domain-containing protein n=1 Tax=Vibrio algarum TaxID=3020714 RepID=A0ABT4YMR3_9VIBR|nr:hypothetical protein [Vibrio sp. KJ40-1]MDB1122839.1 hypothetical protein [Vibrio sp. KJ40-1]
MTIKRLMQANESLQFECMGDFAFIAQATGDIRLRDGQGSYLLKQGAQIKSATLRGRLYVDNLGDTGVVEIITGNGEYIAPQLSQMEVVKQPPMEIQAGQSIDINVLPAIQIEAGQAIEVSALPELQIEAGQSIEVNALPAIQVEAGQSIEVSALPLANGFESTVGEMPHTIDESLTRTTLIIKAMTTNVSPVLVGAFELHGGEKLQLNTTAEITLTGDVGDQVSIIEVHL